MNRPTKTHDRALLEKIEAEIKRIQRQLLHLRKHDILTGIVNLAFIREKLDGLTKKKANQSSMVGVLLLGIDNFSMINVRFGSAKGDLVLQEVTARILQHQSFDMTLARKGGDEFIILLNNVHSPGSVAQFAQEVMDILSYKFCIDQQEIYLTVSMGICLYPQDAHNGKDLLAYADIAFRYAKRHGKNNYQFFTKIMGNKVSHMQKIQEYLPKALQRHEFFLCYQPQISAGGVIVCFEALLRWNHPTLGLLHPHDFILIAEEKDEMISIGNWVLHEACVQLKAWHAMGYAVRVALNVSARQFYCNHMKAGECLTDNVISALREADLQPQFLELEISERMMMKNTLVMTDMLKKLKEIGVRIVCDDFGVGYSSFSRLKSLSLDGIKIDRSLIVDLAENKVDIAIVKSVIDISKQLNSTVVAEGVEHGNQYEILEALGCDLFQGFYVGKPMAEKDVLLFLKKRSHRL